MKKYIVLLLVTLYVIIVFNLSYTQSNSQTNTNQKAYLEEFYSKDNNTLSPSQNETKPANPIWTIIKTFLYVGFFGILGYFLIIYIIKKNSPQSSDESTLTELILTKHLGIGNYIQIVRVGTQYYILGIASGNMILIDKINDKETIDNIELNKEKFKPEKVNFIDLLSFIPINKKSDKLDFIKKQKSKLKNL